MKVSKSIQYVVGVDEVGRGPLAGPLAVGAFCVPVERMRDFKKFSVGVRDSKKLSEKKREEWFGRILHGVGAKKFSFVVSFASTEIIDRHGLSFALHTTLSESLKKLKIPPTETLVLLDGGLYAPKEYLFQKTIIKGDEKEQIISLSSIAAKVLRDRKMVALAKKYPEYGFEKHKGYGTALHYDAILQFGEIEKIHRKSFLSKIFVA
jgi:ribonuclease HII